MTTWKNRGETSAKSWRKNEAARTSPSRWRVFIATDKPTPAESGLAALVLLLRFQGVGVDPEQIRHRFGDEIGVSEMLRCA